MLRTLESDWGFHFTADRMKQEKNQDRQSIAYQIESWERLDKNIRKWLETWCQDFTTFGQIGNSYPKGSQEFMDELRERQDGKLIEKQRKAVGILFEMVAKEENGM